MDGTPVPEEVLSFITRTTAKYETIDKTFIIDQKDGEIWLHKQWDGLPEERDLTWSSHKDMYPDARKWLGKIWGKPEIKSFLPWQPGNCDLNYDQSCTTAH